MCPSCFGLTHWRSCLGALLACVFVQKAVHHTSPDPLLVGAALRAVCAVTAAISAAIATANSTAAFAASATPVATSAATPAPTLAPTEVAATEVAYFTSEKQMLRAVVGWGLPALLAVTLSQHLDDLNVATGTHFNYLAALVRGITNVKFHINAIAAHSQICSRALSLFLSPQSVLPTAISGADIVGASAVVGGHRNRAKNLQTPDRRW